MTSTSRVRLAYLVSHPIQYQAPLLRRIAQEPDIDLTVFFASDLSVRGYRDEGFGVHVAWDTPLLEGYRHEFLPVLRDNGSISSLNPINRGIYKRLRLSNGAPAFDALWVHGYASLNNLAAIVSAKALGIPVLLRAESWLADRPRSKAKLALKAAFFRLLRHGITATLPIGSRNQSYWRHNFGEGMPQFAMPYAVDNQRFAEQTRTAAQTASALRQQLGLTRPVPCILFASKLQARKQADHLLRAYRQLLQYTEPQQHPYLILVGDGGERVRLESLSAELHLEHVRFAGFRNQTELPRFFALADLFVLPSRQEPWGLIVNEAMAAGCPVIVSSDAGCHPDLITDGVEGFVYPVGDIAALTQALQQVLADPNRAASMARAAQRRVAQCSYEADVRGLRQALAFATRKLRA